MRGAQPHWGQRKSATTGYSWIGQDRHGRTVQYLIGRSESYLNHQASRSINRLPATTAPIFRAADRADDLLVNLARTGDGLPDHQGRRLVGAIRRVTRLDFD